MVKLLISNGANVFNSGLQGACEGGHKDLVLLILSLGANYLDSGLNFACKGGHLEIVYKNDYNIIILRKNNKIK